MDMFITVPETAAANPHVHCVREAGSEGIELVMWPVARDAFPRAQTVARQRACTASIMYPHSNAPMGHLVLTP